MQYKQYRSLSTNESPATEFHFPKNNSCVICVLWAIFYSFIYSFHSFIYSFMNSQYLLIAYTISSLVQGTQL